jgi:hypothetical protein|eukprot:COSAG01_NODE_203_length_22128_cov_280.658359_18_plen_148_part_00
MVPLGAVFRRGIGDHYPQLSRREVIETASRYRLCQGYTIEPALRWTRVSSSDDSTLRKTRSNSERTAMGDAQRAFKEIKIPDLRAAVKALVNDVEDCSFFSLASSASELLCGELILLSDTKDRARDNNICTQSSLQRTNTQRSYQLR